MAIKNIVSSDFYPRLLIVKSIFNCRLSGVGQVFHVQHTRVKSGNFRHQVNSDMHLQTVKIQMRGFSLFAKLIFFILQ